MNDQWSIDTLLELWEKGDIGRLDFALDVISNVRENDNMGDLISKLPKELFSEVYDLAKHYPHTGGYLQADDSSRPWPTEQAVVLLRAAMERTPR